MLPLSLYELLPYVYLGIGAVGCALSDSELILIASVLIILAGFIILWMRIDYRRTAFDSVTDNIHFVKRSGMDRRKNDASAFPLIDGSGETVKADRRVGDRRSLAA